MRITNKMLSNNFLSDMQLNLQNLSKIQQQMSSTKNFSKPSDDPFNVVRSMQLQTDINANKQYKTNITSALNFMNTTDTALGQIGSMLGNVRDNLVKAGDAAYGSDERDKIADEVNQRVAQLAQQLNTSFQGDYIFAGTRGLSKPVMTVTDAQGNISIKYAGKDGAELVNQDIPVVQTSSVNLNDWKGKSITFTFKQENPPDPPTNISASVSIPEDPGDPDKKSEINSVDDLVKKINTEIQNGALKDKVTASKTSDGNIKFLSVNTSDDIEITETSIDDLESLKNNQFSNLEMDNLLSKRKMEVAQGVVVEYNANVSEVLQYGSDEKDNTMELLNRIVHHLNGQIEDGSGGWTNSSDEATAKLIGEDLSDMDLAAKQAIKVRSEVGAKSNRMDDLSDQNDDSNINMTDILSKTEDIDITEKTIEYYTMVTVYQASLQTSAKVIQPTLMDYIR
ncbi:flagellar hook-associated protein FlgL [Clostridium tyrobutyricum]|uniref:flagellar hook-associated protein FlgL n=1 Tax=Clostridium tyrobutyricum TaxID=1519 RepID=UPI00189FB9BA|nr:flagellar hook-associated protein FlgL [Clostridium tyrobutyricum]